MARISISEFIRTQRTALPVPRADMAGKTVLVTGANTGLGLESAKHFAHMKPARLIVACRNQDKGDAAVAEIARETGYTGAEVRLLDMGTLAGVTSFCDKFEADGGRLDVLLCNAGIAPLKYEPSPDGWETTLQVNHLSTALVAVRLLPRLLETATEANSVARLVVVSSGLHLGVTLPQEVVASSRILRALNERPAKSEFTGTSLPRYSTTKMLNVMLVRALTGALAAAAPLAAVSVDPGFCLSSLRRELAFPAGLRALVMEKLIARTGEEGARAIVWAAVGAEGGVQNMRGRFAASCAIHEESDFVLSKTGQECERRIWDETLEILSAADPKVKTVVETYLKE